MREVMAAMRLASSSFLTTKISPFLLESLPWHHPWQHGAKSFRDSLCTKSPQIHGIPQTITCREYLLELTGSSQGTVRSYGSVSVR